MVGAVAIGGIILIMLTEPSAPAHYDEIVKMTIGITISTIYFVSVWILPSRHLLKGLKEEGPKKFLPWILSMLFHPTLFLIFFEFGILEELQTPMLLTLIPQVFIWTVAVNMRRY